jgi:hypothetical protein
MSSSKVINCQILIVVNQLQIYLWSLATYYLPPPKITLFSEINYEMLLIFLKPKKF